jgi:HD-like signal output (HDOD) protein
MARRKPQTNPGPEPAERNAASPVRAILVVGSDHWLDEHLGAAVRGLPGRWELLSARDGAAAGRRLAERAVQVAIVALDPALGGLAFLDWLRVHHPRITRIAAFPHATAERMVKVANVAHLSVGPETPEAELAQLIGRTIGLQVRLGSENLIALAGSLRRIPSMPSIYAELQAMMSDPDFDLTQVATVIGRDPGLAVKVLQIVNSAFYGLRQRVADLGHAVVVLGSNVVSALVLGVTIQDQFSMLGASRHILDREWRFAVETSKAAKAIAEDSAPGRRLAEAAFLAGLLHNVGRLILAANYADRFASVDWPDDRRAMVSLERSTFGAGHPELGALLLGTWGLADDLVDAVAYYVEPGTSLAVEFSPLTALHLAVASTPGGASLRDEAYLRRIDAGWSTNGP